MAGQFWTIALYRNKRIKTHFCLEYFSLNIIIISDAGSEPILATESLILKIASSSQITKIYST